MNATPSPDIGAKRIITIFSKVTKSYMVWVLVIVICLVALTILGTVAPIYYKQFFDALSTNQLDVATKALIVALAIKAVVIVLWRPVNLSTNHVQTRVMADLSNMAFSNLIHHSYEFFTNSFVGSLTKRVNRFSRAYEAIFDQLVYSLIPLFVSVTSILVVVYHRSQEIALAMLVWFLGLLYINYLVIQWKQKYEEQRAELDSKAGAVAADSLTNSNTIKTFSAFKHEEGLFASAIDALRKIRFFTWTINDVITAVQAVLGLGIEIVVMFGAFKLYQQGQLTIGDFVLFQTYILMMINSLWGISRVIKSIFEAFADAKEMVEIIDKPYDVQDVPGAKELVVTNGAIEFKDIVFNFNETRTVLDGFNLSIAPGEKIAFVGSSGAGKSTLTKLLFRFYDVTGGMITVDGQDISKVTQESLRNAISLVPQEPILFHRTLRENIAYGRRDATNEEIIAAAKKAHCHDFISQLPDGYDTLVGERGVKLSGGERQRVAIARAILKDAPILVLDEATSSLDSESEMLIQDALKTLMEGKTVIVIAHRLSTINTMDRIVVVEDGKVRATGTHSELLKHDDVYKKFWDIQAGGFIGEE